MVGNPKAIRAVARGCATNPVSLAVPCHRVVGSDGDLMYVGPGSFWTAAHHKVPLFTIVHNNRAYHQEVMHLQRMANRYNREITRANIGVEITNPNIDYAKLAQSMGWYAEGPITDPKEIAPALKRAIAVVEKGEPALIDAVDAISGARDSLDGGSDLDQGIRAIGSASNIVPLDTNGIAFSRSTGQVLNIVKLRLDTLLRTCRDEHAQAGRRIHFDDAAVDLFQRTQHALGHHVHATHMQAHDLGRRDGARGDFVLADRHPGAADARVLQPQVDEDHGKQHHEQEVVVLDRAGEIEPEDGLPFREIESRQRERGDPGDALFGVRRGQIRIETDLRHLGRFERTLTIIGNKLAFSLLDAALMIAGAFRNFDPVMEEASEQPARMSGIRTVFSGFSTFAVSAMKCTPAWTITSAFTLVASRASWSESPTKSATQL